MVGYVAGAVLLLLGSAVGIANALSSSKEHNFLISQLQLAHSAGTISRKSFLVFSLPIRTMRSAAIIARGRFC